MEKGEFKFYFRKILVFVGFVVGSDTTPASISSLVGNHSSRTLLSLALSEITAADDNTLIIFCGKPF